MRLDQFSGIVAFLKVAETKSFTRAAAELGVTSPSLSEAIKGLEDRLGVRLLNRTTRSVGLTEAGEIYLARVRPAAEEVWEASQEIKHARDRPSGRLRLSLPWIALPLLVEPIMGAFLGAYPEISLDLVFDDGFVDLAGEGFDAGLRIGELLDKDMIGARIGGPLSTVVVASQGYLERHGAPEKPSDLVLHRCVAFRFARTRAISAWEMIEDGREIVFTPETRVTANSLALCVTAAVQGLGITYAVEGLVKSDVANGDLVRVLEPHCPTYEPLHLYWPGRRLVPPKVRAFVDFVRRNPQLLPI